MKKNVLITGETLKKVWKRGKAFVRRRYKGILYYCAVALVLTLVASAAENYRSGKNGGQALILPENMAEEVISENTGSVIYPENMVLLRPFGNQPVWNDILGQWEIHAANDYAFDGGVVVCLAGGTLKDLGESSVRGGYIEIEAHDGMVYVYSSICPSVGLQAGDEVFAGDIIGAADDSMPSEMLLGDHIHLEVYKDGVLSDFERICEKNGETAD